MPSKTLLFFFFIIILTIRMTNRPTTCRIFFHNIAKGRVMFQNRNAFRITTSYIKSADYYCKWLVLQSRRFLKENIFVRVFQLMFNFSEIYNLHIINFSTNVNYQLLILSSNSMSRFRHAMKKKQPRFLLNSIFVFSEVFLTI